MPANSPWDRRPQFVPRLIAIARGIAITSGLLTLAVIVCVAVVLHLPSFWLEPVIASVSGDLIRLKATTGAIGDGQGELWVRGEAGANWSPWMPLRWSLSAVLTTDPVTGGRAIAIKTNRGVVFATWHGVSLSRIDLPIPPSLLLVPVSHPLAKAQWNGDIRLTADQVTCHWRAASLIQRCEGQIDLVCFAVSSPIFSIPEFGDYRLSLTARLAGNPPIQARISTINGMLRLAGTLDATARETRYRIEIEGELAKINGLENIMGPSLRKTEQPGRYILEKR